ncbi:MAG: hypothetical protein QMD86_00655 [Patescibacteria group bacterium]|nr:hypothetical protein [Patescibacteria group bacterium]
MKQKILSAGILISAIVISLFIVSGNKIFAQEQQNQQGGEIANIQFPVAELGNCKDKTDCKKYCDEPSRMDICLNFAEKNKLMDKREMQMARIIIKEKGPGGCKNKEECEAYCDDVSHIKECISFAEKNGLMDQKELEEARKVQAAIDKGIKPPPCGGKDRCEMYCSSPDHMEECMNFALQAGLMDEDEKDEAQKVLQAVKNGAIPPPCGGKKECDAYCSEENHFEECIAFAEKAGFMKADEAQMARKTKGKGPGGCKGREECDAFCNKEENFQVCVDFGVQNGMMTPEEAKMAKKTGGKGPGGCKSKNECEAYCKDNQEACMQFGIEHGMIPAEDLQKMKEGKQQMIKAVNEAPQEVLDCIKQIAGDDAVEKMKSETGMPSQQIGQAMQECFEKLGGQIGPRGEKQEFEPGESGMREEQRMMPRDENRGLDIGKMINSFPPEIRGCVAPALTQKLKDFQGNPKEIIDQIVSGCGGQLPTNQINQQEQRQNIEGPGSSETQEVNAPPQERNEQMPNFQPSEEQIQQYQRPPDGQKMPPLREQQPQAGQQPPQPPSTEGQAQPQSSNSKSSITAFILNVFNSIFGRK